MKKQSDGKNWIRSIGANFHALRIEQQKDIETVAEAMNISPALLRKIENGRYDMPLQLYIDLCSYYGVSLRDVATENKFGKP